MAKHFGFLRLSGFYSTDIESYYRAMKRPYGQFIGFAGFEPCENLWGCVIKERNEVFVPEKAVYFLPIDTGNPITVEVRTCHFGLFA